MLRFRAPAAEAEKAGPQSRQQKKLVQKLEDKKAKRAGPAVAEEPVSPEFRRRRLVCIVLCRRARRVDCHFWGGSALSETQLSVPGPSNAQMKIGGAIFSFLIIAYALEVR